MSRYQVWVCRGLTPVIASFLAGCPASKTEDSKTEDHSPPAPPVETAPPQSQPGSSASSASLPADHSTATTKTELKDVFRMPESPTDVVLNVGGREVKRAALEVQLRQIQVELNAVGSPKQLSRLEILNGAVERLIELEMRALLGEELKIKVDPKKVQAWLDDLESRTAANPSFKAFLLRAGRDEEARKKDAFNAVLMAEITAAIEDRAHEQLTKDAEAYYARRKVDYFERAGREVWRMTLKAPRSMVQRDRDLAKEQASALYAKVKKNPKNFVNFAKSHSQDGKASDGGYLGYVAKGTFTKDVEDQIWAAKTGSVLPMRDAPVGFYIYKVGKKRKDRQKPFEEVKDKIMATIYATSIRKLVSAELNQMRDAHKVEVLIPEWIALRAEQDKKMKALEERLKNQAVSHSPSESK